MKTIKAAVGILRNKQNKILIAKRRKNQFMGGFWELPGGKIKPNETAKETVIRELKEELGIDVSQVSLYKSMLSDYPDRSVVVNIFTVDKYQSIPRGIEGQQIQWVEVEAMADYPLLPNMRALMQVLILPDKYWITPAVNHYSKSWQATFDSKLSENIGLIQLRSKIRLEPQFIDNLYQKSKQSNSKLLINIPNPTFTETYCDGWHLSGANFSKLTSRPCAADKLLAISTHNLAEAVAAQKMGADFIVISAIKATKTHPDTKPIGWNVGEQVAAKLNIAVYFLGGMRLNNLNQAKKAGAQGIAGVSGF